MKNYATTGLSEITPASLRIIGPVLTSDERYRRAKLRDEQTFGAEQVNPLTWEIRMAELVAAGRIRLISSVEHYATHPNGPTTEGSSERQKRKNLATSDRIIALAQALPRA